MQWKILADGHHEVEIAHYGIAHSTPFLSPADKRVDNPHAYPYADDLRGDIRPKIQESLEALGAPIGDVYNAEDETQTKGKKVDQAPVLPPIPNHGSLLCV